MTASPMSASPMTASPWHRLLLSAAAAAATAAMTGSATADAIADFYQAQQVQKVVRSSPGGSYELYSRLVANHMVKYTPGNPTTIMRYMTGAAGIQAANYMENQAPKDGTVMSIISNGIPADQALGLAEGLKA